VMGGENVFRVRHDDPNRNVIIETISQGGRRTVMAQRYIPEIKDGDGTEVRIVCGNFWGTSGPVDGIAADPIYLDVSVPPGRRKSLPVETTRHAFAYVFARAGKFCNASGPLAVPTEGVGWADTTPPAEADNRSLVLFDRGDEVTVQAGDDGIRFLLVSGKPLGEPVAWYGPIVMNTQAQLRQAFEELDRGTLLHVSDFFHLSYNPRRLPRDLVHGRGRTKWGFLYPGLPARRRLRGRCRWRLGLPSDRMSDRRRRCREETRELHYSDSLIRCRYASRANSYALTASPRSASRMRDSFDFQH